MSSNRFVLFGLFTILLVLPFRSHAAGGEKTSAFVRHVAARVGKQLNAWASHPIPLYRGKRGSVLINIAPKVTEGRKNLVLGVVPRVHAADSLALGLVGAHATGQDAAAIGPLWGHSRDGLGAGFFGLSDAKTGVGFFGAGEKAFGFSASAGEHAVGVAASTNSGTADGVFAVTPFGKARSILLSLGGSEASSGLLALGAHKNTSLLVNPLTAGLVKSLGQMIP